MKVLLLSCPYHNRPKEILFPIGIAYLATQLSDHRVWLFDPNVFDDPYERAIEIVNDLRPDVVGISFRNMNLFKGRRVPFRNLFGNLQYGKSCIPDLQKFAKGVRDLPFTVKIAVGGAGYSLAAEEIMHLVPEIDMGAFGEGEVCFRDYLRNIDNPRKARGIYIREGDRVIHTGQPEIFDLNDLGLPDDLSLLEPGRYSAKWAIGVQTKRGCAFKCTYCNYPYIEGARLRLRPPSKIVDDIELLRNKYGRSEIYFADSVFNFPPQHCLDICEEIIRRNVKIEFKCYLRPDNLDGALLERLLEAGLVGNLVFSLDALSKKGLAILRKDMDFDKIHSACNLAKAKGLTVGSSIFPDISSSDIGSMFETIFNGLRLYRFGNVAIECTMLRVYARTPIERYALDRGLINPDHNLVWPHFLKSSLPGFSVVLFFRLLNYIKGSLQQTKSRLRETGQKIFRKIKKMLCG